MILLTGATGFVGRHLLDGLLLKYGPGEIVAYTRSPIAGVKCICHNGYEAESFDFLAMGLGDIETILHAGAFIPKNNTESDNQVLADLNVFVTNCLLKARLPNLKRFVYLSTVDVYAPGVVIDESSPLGSMNPYSRSKLLGEELVKEWAKMQGNIGQVLRLGHVYGPGEEKFRKIIPETMRRIINGQPLCVFGTGKQRRSFIYVKDASRAILAALDLERNIEPINIAGCYSISMDELIKLITEISDTKPIVEIVPSSDERDLVFDTSKMRKYLLANEIPLHDGLKMEWDYMIGRGNENPY